MPGFGRLSDKAFTVDYGNRHQQACSPDCGFELRRVKTVARHAAKRALAIGERHEFKAELDEDAVRNLYPHLHATRAKAGS